MKRFQWRLQRVLDITAQRERAARAELLALANGIASLRQELFRRRAVLRELLAEIEARPLQERLADQALFLETSAVEEEAIDRLRERLAALRAEREEKQTTFLRLRATRETLERLREEARETHRREARRREQAAFDEAHHVAFARRNAAERPETSV